MLKITLCFSASKPQYAQYQELLLGTIYKENKTMILLLCLCIAKRPKSFSFQEGYLHLPFSSDGKALSIDPKITYRHNYSIGVFGTGFPGICLSGKLTTLLK